MKVVFLSRGEQALVDDEDFERVNAHKWSKLNHGAAQARIGTKRVQMHRFIMNAVPGEWVDHANHDRLDNRRSNLRFCTPQQNNANKRSWGATGFKGVVDLESVSSAKPRKRHYKTSRKRYWVRVQQRTIGYFDCPVEAAKAYEVAAREVFGEFTCTKKVSKTTTTAVDFA